MYNEELYKKLEKDFGVHAMITFSYIASKMYNYIYEDSTKSVINEASYERDWWKDKNMELHKKL